MNTPIKRIAVYGLASCGAFLLAATLYGYQKTALPTNADLKSQFISMNDFRNHWISDLKSGPLTDHMREFLNESDWAGDVPPIVSDLRTYFGWQFQCINLIDQYQMENKIYLDCGSLKSRGFKDCYNITDRNIKRIEKEFSDDPYLCMEF